MLVAVGLCCCFALAVSSRAVEENPEDGEKEVVLMEDTGPGALVRWWLTNNRTDGEIRIYLDGSTKPVLQMRVPPFVAANPAFGKELLFRSRPSHQAQPPATSPRIKSTTPTGAT